MYDDILPFDLMVFRFFGPTSATWFEVRVSSARSSSDPFETESTFGRGFNTAPVCFLLVVMFTRAPEHCTPLSHTTMMWYVSTCSRVQYAVNAKSEVRPGLPITDNRLLHILFIGLNLFVLALSVAHRVLTQFIRTANMTCPLQSVHCLDKYCHIKT